ncbi:MAG: hypothetical protein PF489_14560 [Salinivirgaceae bacterium]|jgi:hypothetical protein|nr:hypothetical protein [Salinivirgaceae bacterium]
MKRLFIIVLLGMILSPGIAQDSIPQEDFLEIQLEISGMNMDPEYTRIDIRPMYDSIIKDSAIVEVRYKPIKFVFPGKFADIHYIIPKSIYDSILNMVYNLSYQKILKGNDLCIWHDARYYRLKVSVSGINTSVSIASPQIDPEKRKIVDYLYICKRIIRAASLDEDVYF